MPDRTITLTKHELDQLLIYAKAYEYTGHYFGNKSYFDKRHKNIVAEILRAIGAYSG